MPPTDITITVPVTALDAAARERIAELTRERDEARAGQAAYEDLAKKAEERSAFFAARSDEARAALAKAEKERDEAIATVAEFREWSALKRERDDARRRVRVVEQECDVLRATIETDRIGGRVATDFLNARIRVLEDAIRTLAKVLP
jgi:hypothetical protein